MELTSYKEEIVLYDAGGTPINTWVEVRIDPLTGDVSRVINVPLRDWSLPDLEKMARETRENCPFCPEHLGEKTPRFDGGILPEGILRRGKAVLIPNRFPYDRYCALIILSESHFVPLDAWEAREVFDGLMIAQTFLNRVLERDDAVNAFSLNWNYAAFANNRGRRLMEISYSERLKGRDPVEELLAEERSRGQRWCGMVGPWCILFAFAPRGRFFELQLIHESVGCFPELAAEDVESLASAIAHCLRFVPHMGFSSMNLSLFSPLREPNSFHPMVSISPRACVGPYQMSDISFQMLIDEFFCLFLPEFVAARFRDEWGEEEISR